MSHPTRVLQAACLLLPALPAASSTGLGETVQRELFAMGTHLGVQVEAGDRASALAASEAARIALREVEQRLSTWAQDSELAALNRAAVGETFRLSPELRADLETAQELRARTAGCFDPGIGALVAAWGLREGGRRPSPAEIETALADGGLASLALDADGGRRLKPSMTIEEGGFGKGVGLDAALEQLLALGVSSARLDLGGQLAWFGAGDHELPLAHPDQRDLPVLSVRLKNGSAATSGNSERGIEIDGVRHSHLIDPRNGQPAPDFGSVTVWAKSATTADALSTALFVMGPETGLRWAAETRGIEAIFLVRTETGLVARATDGLEGRIRMNQNVTIQFFTEQGVTPVSFVPPGNEEPNR